MHGAAQSNRELCPVLMAATKFYFGPAENFFRPLADKEILKLPYPTIACQLEVKKISVITLLREGNQCVELFVFNETDQGFYSHGSLTLMNASPEIFYYIPSLSATTENTRKQLLLSSLGMMVRTLEVLNCRNVFTQMISPPPKLNKKRISSGKVPIYAHKILVLRRKSGRNLPLGGSHSSPVVHLRRGHVKRRNTGEFWWQPCIVGNPERGTLTKDYDVRRLMPAPLALLAPSGPD